MLGNRNMSSLKAYGNNVVLFCTLLGWGTFPLWKCYQCRNHKSGEHLINSGSDQQPLKNSHQNHHLFDSWEPQTKMLLQLSTYKLLTTHNPQTNKKTQIPRSLESFSLMESGLTKLLFLYNLLPLMQPMQGFPPKHPSPGSPVLGWRGLPSCDNPQFMAGRNFLEKGKKKNRQYYSFSFQWNIWKFLIWAKTNLNLRYLLWKFFINSECL